MTTKTRPYRAEALRLMREVLAAKSSRPRSQSAAFDIDRFEDEAGAALASAFLGERVSVSRLRGFERDERIVPEPMPYDALLR